MATQPVIVDERAVAVAGTSYRLAWMVLAFGVLVDVVVRGLVLREASWDLLALAIGSGLVATVYQWIKRAQVFARKWTLILVLIGAVVAAAIVGFMAASQ